MRCSWSTDHHRDNNNIYYDINERVLYMFGLKKSIFILVIHLTLTPSHRFE